MHTIKVGQVSYLAMDHNIKLEFRSQRWTRISLMTRLIHEFSAKRIKENKASDQNKNHGDLMVEESVQR